MSEEQIAELIGYVRDLSGALCSIAKTLELDYNRKYPPRRPVRDVDITYVKTEEEKLLEEQGQTGEATLREWTDIGPREQAVLEREEAARARAVGPGNGADETRRR